MSKEPSSERTTAVLDAAAVRVLAYAKQEREEAIAAAMLHVEISASEKVPRLALRYSNYLAPLAKKELLKGLQGGVSVATEFLSTAWSSLRESLKPFAAHIPDGTPPTYLKLLLLAAGGGVLYLLFAIVIPALWSLLGVVVLLLFGSQTFVKNELKKRTPVFVTNEVALEVANKGEKSSLKERLHLTLLEHDVQTRDELVDELWELLTP